MTDVLVGCATAPLRPKKLYPWIASFRRIRPDADVVLLADPADAYRELAYFFGVDVQRANLRTDPFDVGDGDRGCVSVYADRWPEVRALCQRRAANDRVLMTDVSDVVFQRDPFARLPERGVLVAGEGVRYKDDPWNRRHLMAHFPHDGEAMAEHETLCAGVVGGSADAVRAFADQMTSRCRWRTGMAEQQAFNVLLRRDDVLYEIASEDDAWAIHCAQRITPWALNRASRIAPLRQMPVWQNGVLTNRAGAPYAIVHHWPAVPMLKQFELIE